MHPRVEFASNRQTILVDAAIAGLGIANLPTFLVQDAVRAGHLIFVLPAWEPSPVEMTALWQKDKITYRLVSAIVTEFAGVFDSGAPKSKAAGPGERETRDNNQHPPEHGLLNRRDVAWCGEQLRDDR